MTVTFHEFPITQLLAGTNREVTGLTGGPDGALYLSLRPIDPTSPSATSAIGRITTDGSITQLPLPKSVLPESIVARSDGAFWFIEGNTQNYDRIGRITTDGKLTEYAISSSFYEKPFSIAAGPDGAIWFLTGNFFPDGIPSIDGIGRITTDGKVSEFSLPPGESFGDDFAADTIVAGPDGALWFNERGRHRIGRITTDGKTTDFAVPGPAPLANLNDITAGPDGALWFTEPVTSQIGRITTAGVVTQFPLPAGTFPGSIAPGPDGAVWFTDPYQGTLGRITPAGVVTQMPIPNANSSDRPGGLLLGPDHNLWFLLSAGAIAQAAISTTPTTTTIVASPTFVPPGRPISLSAVVTPQGTGGAVPTGTVSFVVDGTPQPPVPLVSSGGADMATLTLPSLPEGTHRIGAVYNGDAAFATSVSSVTAQVLVSPAARWVTTTTVTAAPNPGTAGQPITLTAAITSTPPAPPAGVTTAPAPASASGVVTFFVDGAEVASAPLQPVGAASGLARAVVTAPAAGAHRVVASYSGDPSLTPSASAPFAEAVRAADGPRVASLRRYGFHAQPTLLLLAFDGPLAPATAQAPANYRVVGPVGPRGHGGRADPVVAAAYDAAGHTVALALRHRLDVHLRYRLTVVGSAPTGVSGPDGALLDGAGDGRPGSDFVRAFGREILAGPAPSPGSAARWRLAHRASPPHVAAPALMRARGKA